NGAAGQPAKADRQHPSGLNPASIPLRSTAMETKTNGDFRRNNKLTRWLPLVLACALAILLGACAGVSNSGSNTHPAPVTGSGGFHFAPPSEVARQLSYTVAGLGHVGSDYQPVDDQNVQKVKADALFSPTGELGNQVATAMYYFDVEGYDK